MLISVEGGNILPLWSLLGKHFTKTDWCAGALSWRKTQLPVLHCSGRFLLTVTLKRWRMSMYVSLFTLLQFPSCSISCKLCQKISVSYTGEFRELFEAIAENMNSPLRTILGKAVGSVILDRKQTTLCSCRDCSQMALQITTIWWMKLRLTTDPIASSGLHSRAAKRGWLTVRDLSSICL
jgi:hypothetical protein